MQFTVAALIAAAVAGVSAQSSYSNVTYTTEVVTALTTYCPVATEITHGGKTYTVTSATTLTITDCPCTISKPVYTSKVVECKTCNATSPAAPQPPKPTAPTASLPAGTGAFTPSKPPTSVPTVPTTAGAGKAAALSGAAAFVAFAALAL